MSKVFSDWIGSSHEFIANYVEYSDTELEIVKEFLQKEVDKRINSPDFKVVFSPTSPPPENPPSQQQGEAAARFLYKSIRKLLNQDMEEEINFFVEGNSVFCCEHAQLDADDKSELWDEFWRFLIVDHIRMGKAMGAIPKNLFNYMRKYEYLHY